MMPPRSDQPPSVPHLPAIDGLRAVAVVVVIVYHLPARWLPGGFLGVSTFFTVSGFVITRLLMAEFDATGRIAYGAFLVRRARRLLPAALVTVGAVTLVWSHGPFDQLARIRPADVTWTTLFANNLHAWADGHSYGDLFGLASPFQHFWSLAVEEQFYVLWPLVLLLVAKVARGTRRPLAILALAAVSAGFALAASSDGSYYLPMGRAHELLVGAALATVLTPARVARLGSPGRSRAIALAAAGAAIGCGLLWSQVDLAATQVVPMDTAANAALTAVVIVACVVPGPPWSVGALLGRRRAVWVGRRSYGLYLLHWPVFLILSPARIGWPAVPLTAARVAVTVVLSALLFAALEDPIRRGHRLPSRAALTSALAGSFAVALFVAASVPQPANQLDFSTSRIERVQREALAPLRANDVAVTANILGAAAVPTTVVTPAPPTIAGTTRATRGPTTLAPSTVAPTSTTTTTTSTTTTAPVPLRSVLFVGDSNAFAMGSGLARWATASNVELRLFPGIGCGLFQPSKIRYLNREGPASDSCAAWRAHIDEAVTNSAPDVVVVVGMLADLSDQAAEDGTWTHIGEPAFDARLAAQLDAFATELMATGARVVWLTFADVKVTPNPETGPPPFVEEDPARPARLNELIRAMAAQRADVTVGDLAAFVRSWPGGPFDRTLRPDGVHVDTNSNPEASAWLIDLVVTAHSAPAEQGS
jgi:peptidoglycan/LPS O-acetylase OafA/YrhL